MNTSFFYCWDHTQVYTHSKLNMPKNSEGHTGEVNFHFHFHLWFIQLHTQSWLSSLSNSSSEQSVSYISTSWYSSNRDTGFAGWSDPRCFFMNFISWATRFLSTISLSSALNSDTKGKICSMAAWTFATHGAVRIKIWKIQAERITVQENNKP